MPKGPDCSVWGQKAEEFAVPRFAKNAMGAVDKLKEMQFAKGCRTRRGSGRIRRRLI